MPTPSADQGGQDRSELRDGEDVGEHADDRGADSDGHQGRDQRQEGAQEGAPEGEEQHDEGEEDSEALAGGLPVLLAVFDGVAAELDVEDRRYRPTWRC